MGPPPSSRGDGNSTNAVAIVGPGGGEDILPPEPVDLDPDAFEVDLNHFRLRKIENLEVLHQVEVISLRWNFIKKIENLNMLTTLKELELYDNQITKIENLEQLVNLE